MARTSLRSSASSALVWWFQLVAPAQQVAGQARDHAVESVQLHEPFGDDAVALETAGGDRQVRVQFVQVPADLRGDPGALNDQVMPVIRQQLHLPRRSV
jgi:hypothetical protein